VAGKTIVLTTTNGTHAINESREAKKVVIGSFLNLSALSVWLQSQHHDVLLLCAGWKNKVNLEDSLFAGAVAYHLKNEAYKLDDAAILVADLYELAQGDLKEFMKKTSHSERLKELNIEADIAFCLQTDVIDSIPVLDGDRLVKLI
jgi:2-phosphosulfolactate phosphatase